MHELLESRLCADPAAPLLTYYDDASSERTELSAATFANWVAKAACLLSDDLGIDAGTRALVDLPAHWQSAVALHALWRVGAVAVAGAAGPEGAQLLICDEPGLDRARPGPVLAFSLRPLGAGLARPRPGVTDAAEELPLQPDVCPLPPPDPAGPALVLAGSELTQSRLVEAAAALELPTGARVMVVADRWDDLESLLTVTVAPLLTGGSVVVCRNADPDRLGERATTERVDIRR